MKCSDLERFYEDRLMGAAPAEFEAHLEACPRCRATAKELAGTRTLLAFLPSEAPEPSQAFWVGLEERLNEADRKAEFWALLAMTAQRTAVALGVLAVALGLWVWTHPVPPAAAFDAPEVFIAEDSALPGPGGTGPFDRDQVVVTLVARQEEGR